MLNQIAAMAMIPMMKVPTAINLSYKFIVKFYQCDQLFIGDNRLIKRK